MLDFFHYLYAEVIGIDNPLLFGIRYKSIFRELLRVSANFLVPAYYRFSPTPSLPKQKREQQVILSLTSFPGRINRVWIVIESLLRQQIKADRIVLWLSKDQFEGIDLPKSLIKLQKKGLEIRFVEGDIRSHKKYYYTLLEYPNDLLVTVDDDLYYSSSFLRNLMEAHVKQPNAVISVYSFLIRYDERGNVMPYEQWIQPIKEGCYPSGVIFFGSGGGTLFPPQALYPDVLNIDLARELCPLADDVWLNAMCQMSQVNIVKVRGNNILLSIYNHSFNKTETLSSINNGKKLNDIQIKNLMEHYPVFRKLF